MEEVSGIGLASPSSAGFRDLLPDGGSNEFRSVRIEIPHCLVERFGETFVDLEGDNRFSFWLGSAHITGLSVKLSLTEFN